MLSTVVENLRVLVEGTERVAKLQLGDFLVCGLLNLRSTHLTVKFYTLEGMLSTSLYQLTCQFS